MRDPKLDHASMVERREAMLSTAFRLFTERNISAVTMAEIAKAAGCGNKTLHRYYDTKATLVIAVAVWKWSQFRFLNAEGRELDEFKGQTAEEIFRFYLDSFLLLYREHKDLLRFNQFFNIYIQSIHPDDTVMQPYKTMILALESRFHILYERALEDHTVRTDISEEEMFATTLHIMLAAVTRYAVGLVYKPEGSLTEEQELEVLKEMLLERYCTNRMAEE